MKHGKSYLFAVLLSVVLCLFCGCGNAQSSTDDKGTVSGTENKDTTKPDTQTPDSDMIADEPAGGQDDLGVTPDGLTGDTGMDGTANKNAAGNGQAASGNTGETGSSTAGGAGAGTDNAADARDTGKGNSAGQDVGKAVDDVGDAVGSGIKDIGQGVKDLTDDVTGTDNR